MSPDARHKIGMQSAANLALFVTLGATATAFGTPPIAAPITWGSATNISGDGDVSTAGTLLYAYNIGGSSVSGQTVNGVAFAAYAFPPLGANFVDNGTVSFFETVPGGELFGNDSLGSPASPSLGAGYKAILASGGGAMYFASIVSTLGNLTVGRQYELQLWVNNSNDGAITPNPYSGTSYGSVFTSALGSVTLDSNVGDAVGSTGQYVVGTFTATATAHAFSFDGSSIVVGSSTFSGLPLINALQLRDVTPVPGPGGAAVCTVLGAMLRGGRRRRR